MNVFSVFLSRWIMVIFFFFFLRKWIHAVVVHQAVFVLLLLLIGLELGLLDGFTAVSSLRMIH